MKRSACDLLLTGVAPGIWGSTYIVTTQFLPEFPAITLAMLRALPAGLLLLLLVRRLPTGIWWARVVVLGALNYSIFLSLLFVSAYRLPGGLAATVGAVQPLLIVFMAYFLLSTRIRARSVVATVVGSAGVAVMVLTPRAALDLVGVLAGLAAAGSMALGTVLSRKWSPPVSPVTFTAWQLTAGGLLLVPVAFLLDDPFPPPTGINILALLWLGGIGMGLTSVLWLRGVVRLEPSVLAPLILLSPVTAVLLGWVVLEETLNALQIAGVALVVSSILLAQSAQNTLPRQADRQRPGPLSDHPRSHGPTKRYRLT